MTIYQKAIKVIRECENRKICGGNSCLYFDKCIKSKIIFCSPKFSKIERVAKAIESENWKIK